MEYMAMLEEPGLISGLQELIHDTEPSVVKRTIRVFTNVYRHSLSLLATGDLDPVKYEACYAEINMVSNDLIDMLKAADNEGVMVHLVRYLEAALVSHILSDLSHHPQIALMTAPMLKKGVTALLDLVDTPYVGGTAFCVAIRALITVACYQVDMRPKITDVCETLINTPPPNLFDHDVRSFHKTLQRNLFRLLKGADEDAVRERLVDLMVRVGVPRKRLVEWGPRGSKKRPASTTRYDGKGLLPATKKIKVTEEQIIRLSPPAGNRSKIFSPPSSVKRSPPTATSTVSDDPSPSSISSILDQILSGDKASNLNWLPPVKKTERKSINAILKEKSTAAVNCEKEPSTQNLSSSDPLKTIRQILKLPAAESVASDTSVLAFSKQPSKEISSKHSSGKNSTTQKEPLNSPSSQAGLVTSSSSQSPGPASTPNSPVHLSGHNSPDQRKGCDSLKLIPLHKVQDASATLSSVAATFLKTGTEMTTSQEHINNRNIMREQGFSPKERLIHEKLTNERVVEMLLTSTVNVPAEIPKYIPRINLEPLDVMKEKLAILLALYVPESVMDYQSNPMDVENKKAGEKDISIKCTPVISPEILSPEVSSMKTDSLFFSKDFDLRQGVSNNRDIDMRNMAVSCDPRKASTAFTAIQSTNSDPRKRNDVTETHTKAANRDPRLASQSDPRLSSSNRIPSNHAVRTDPRLQKTAPTPVSACPLLPTPPPTTVQTQPIPPPPSRDPRLSARTTPPLTNAYSTPAVAVPHDHRSGAFNTFAGHNSTANYSARPTHPSHTTYAPPNPHYTPMPYQMNTAAPQQPASRDPRRRGAPSGPQGPNSFPVVPSYSVRQPPPTGYPNNYAAHPDANNAYSRRLY